MGKPLGPWLPYTNSFRPDGKNSFYSMHITYKIASPSGISKLRIWSKLVLHSRPNVILHDFNPVVDYKPSVKITTQALIPYIYEWLYLQFKINSERQIFGETCHGNFILFAEFLPEICWEEGAEEIICYISFSWRCLTNTLSTRPWRVLNYAFILLLISYSYYSYSRYSSYSYLTTRMMLLMISTLLNPIFSRSQNKH